MRIVNILHSRPRPNIIQTVLDLTKKYRYYHFKRIHFACSPDPGLLEPTIGSHYVRYIEASLRMNPIEVELENITTETLSVAAKMYLYAMGCSTEYHFWIPFFEDLLLTNKTSQEIILTLNRLMKTNIAPDIIKYISSEYLEKKLKVEWNLKFEKIEQISKAMENMNDNITGKCLLFSNFYSKT